MSEPKLELIIDEILKWVNYNIWFDTKFVRSVKDYISDHSISASQEKAIRKIYDNFNIGSFDYKGKLTWLEKEIDR